RHWRAVAVIQRERRAVGERADAPHDLARSHEVVAVRHEQRLGMRRRRRGRDGHQRHGNLLDDVAERTPGPEEDRYRRMAIGVSALMRHSSPSVAVLIPSPAPSHSETGSTSVLVMSGWTGADGSCRATLSNDLFL